MFYEIGHRPLFASPGKSYKRLLINGTVHFKKVSNYLNTNIYSYFETSGGQSSNQYLNVVHYFNTSVN